MAANPRILPDSAYSNGAALLVPGGTPDTWWATLDAAQVGLWDGYTGGTWSPTSAIEIGGAGMGCAGPWDLAPPAAGTVMVPITAADPLTHGDSDYITLGAAHTMAARYLETEAAQARDSSGCPTLQVYTVAGGGKTGGIMGPTAVMLPSATGLAIGNTPVTGYPYRPGGRFVFALRVAHGAELLAVTFYFAISSQHTAKPDALPQFRVHAVDLYGNLTALGGWTELPWPGNVTAYKATTSYALGCGVTVDTSKYSYYAEVVDESGANATSFNEFYGVISHFTNIKDLRPQ